MKPVRSRGYSPLQSQAIWRLPSGVSLAEYALQAGFGVSVLSPMIRESQLGASTLRTVPRRSMRKPAYE